MHLHCDLTAGKTDILSGRVLDLARQKIAISTLKTDREFSTPVDSECAQPGRSRSERVAGSHVRPRFLAWGELWKQRSWESEKTLTQEGFYLSIVQNNISSNNSLCLVSLVVHYSVLNA